MIKTVISDLGGVVLSRGIWRFWEYIENEFDIPKETSKKTFLENYNAFFSGKISEEIFWKHFAKGTGLIQDPKILRTALLDFFDINNDVIDIYRQLRNNGLKMVLLSDQTKEWWPFLNDKFRIESYFDETIVSALVGINKPNPRIYIKAVEISKSEPEECLFIDDLEHNLEPARNMGMKTILFENSSKLKKELVKLNINLGPRL
jgi:putative hydrolase of the HAD superfamily